MLKKSFILSVLISLTACGNQSDSSGAANKESVNPDESVNINLPNTLVRVTDESPGENCENGGRKIEAGSDYDENEILSENEVEQIVFACNGADGIKGEKGDSGEKGVKGDDCSVLSSRRSQYSKNTIVKIKCGNQITDVEIKSGETSLVKVTQITADKNCSSGGLRVDSGLDTNRDSLLSNSEISDTAFICTQCATDEHRENNSCVYNYKDCSFSDAKGQKEWDKLTETWGACYRVSCNSKDEHIENGKCVYNIKGCNLTNAYNETQTWDAQSKSWGPCIAESCNSYYHLENGICVYNYNKACFIKNGEAKEGEQDWDSANNKWKTCESDEIYYCDESYGLDEDLKYCEEFTDYGFNLNSCDYWYRSSSSYRNTTIKEMYLQSSGQEWCGDFKGRFNKNPKAAANHLIYDNLLKGYWSKISGQKINFLEAQKYCTKMGQGWALPSFLRILSLLRYSTEAHPALEIVYNQSYYNRSYYIWSSNKVVSDQNYAHLVDLENYSSRSFYKYKLTDKHWALCFKEESLSTAP